MKALKRLGAAVFIVLAIVFAFCDISFAAGPGDDGSGSEAQIHAAHFAEPLVATAPTDGQEDLALAQAVASYEGRSDPDDFGSLLAFLAKYPHSGWNSALLTNLGLAYLHSGYFSRALDA